MRNHHIKKDRSIAVLASGGVDSAVLLAWAACNYRMVHPVFVASGLRWESAERAALKRFLCAAELSRMKPVRELRLDSRDLYTGHWSLPRGGKVPASDAAWDSVYLPGRNLLLLSKALVYCAVNRIDDLALGVLKSNPFADVSPRFFKSLELAAAVALGRGVSILAPLRSLHKEEVIRIGKKLPLRHTFSCIDPQRGAHCGRCTKCFERQEGFYKAGVRDKTAYCSKEFVKGVSILKG